MMPFLQANGSTLAIAAVGCVAIYLLLSSGKGNGVGSLIQRLLPARNTATSGEGESTDFGGADKTVDERDLAALDQLRTRATRRKSKKLADAIHGIEAVYFDEGDAQQGA